MAREDQKRVFCRRVGTRCLAAIISAHALPVLFIVICHTFDRFAYNVSPDNIATLQECQEILTPAHPLSNHHLFVALLPWYPSGNMVLLRRMVLLKITRPSIWLLDVM